MKKFLKTITILSIIFFTAASVSSYAKKNPGKTKTSGNNPAGINYVVTITTPECGGMCHTYSVVIKDENGNIIGSPLVFQEGVDNYVFHESGPVSGTRIAYLEKIYVSGKYICSRVLVTQPEQITGYFRSGSTHLFHLYPAMVVGND